MPAEAPTTPAPATGTPITGAPATARARARAELTREIKEAARRQLASDGAAALSLRAIAREMGMVSSAVYRYFPSRDDLLTALIVDAYDAVGAAAEAADAGTGKRDVLSRWRRITAAVRAWALAHPHEYALIYGSPVPGYQAPTDTIAPATRVSFTMLALLVDGVASGEIDPAPGPPMNRGLRADLAQLRDEAAPGVSDDVLALGIQIWSAMFGAISFELFGHLHNVIHDYDALFDVEMRRAGALLLGDQDSSRSSGGKKS